jgi:hypothetical protein
MGRRLQHPAPGDDMPGPRQESASHHAPRDYARPPLNVYWEMTQACALVCRHCRMEAMPSADPMELTSDEGIDLLEQILDFGDPLPHLTLTGGDPLARRDLFELIDAARQLGIGVSITPAATPAFTRDVFARLKAHSAEGLGLSLDGSTRERHDSVRGVPGTFDRTIQAMRWALEPLLPDFGRPGQGVAAAPAGGGRNADGVGVPNLDSVALYRSDHRSAFLPARGPSTDALGGTDG